MALDSPDAQSCIKGHSRNVAGGSTRRLGIAVAARPSRANGSDRLPLARASARWRRRAGAFPVVYGPIAQDTVWRIGPADVEETGQDRVSSAGRENGLVVFRVDVSFQSSEVASPTAMPLAPAFRASMIVAESPIPPAARSGRDTRRRRSRTRSSSARLDST